MTVVVGEIRLSYDVNLVDPNGKARTKVKGSMASSMRIAGVEWAMGSKLILPRRLSYNIDRRRKISPRGQARWLS